MKSRLLAVDDLYVVHITGPKEYDSVVECLALSKEESRRWTVMAYQDRMPETLAAADCAISRAGATSLAEISALGLPALLVPFPYATEDHQTTNAKAYVASGAVYAPDDALDSEEFSGKALRIIEDDRCAVPCARLRADLKRRTLLLNWRRLSAVAHARNRAFSR
ncbi:MAG: UDP-N-acetylglucosamine--N-acetylmuramyl-(pentapeptide) pyrophosphoryl-undecaprenol N-acetylglucosamine transferase [Slackia sp.]